MSDLFTFEEVWRDRIYPVDVYATSLNASYRDCLIRAIETFTLPKRPRVCELGCGTGENLQRLQHILPSDSHLTGIDVNKVAATQAYNALGPSITILEGTIQSLLPVLYDQDLIFTCYTLAYVHPVHMQDVLTLMWKRASQGIVIAEIVSEDTSVLHEPKDYLPEWHHPFKQLLSDVTHQPVEKRAEDPARHFEILVVRK